MNAAIKEIVKTRGYEQRQIKEAYEKIEHHKGCIQVLLDSIQRKEQLVSEYDAIIKHSEQLLSKQLTDSIP